MKNLVYLAAGKGSRLPEKCRKKPKCLTLINKKSILLRNLEFINKFKNKLIITGYKKNKLKKYIKKYNFREIVNKNFQTTNMVHSLMLAKQFLYKKNSVIICYGDILFDHKISNFFNKKNGNIMPVNYNWFNYWKKRMNLSKVKIDAEMINIKKKKVISIGGKIKKKIPRHQYMGILKLTSKSFNKMFLYYKKVDNKKIDMTTFLNLCLERKIISIKAQNYYGMWHEIDNFKDIKLAEEELA